MIPNTPLGIDDEMRRDGAVPRPSPLDFAGHRAPDLFPGYTNIREITRQTYAATPRGRDETVVLRVLPLRHFADPRHQMRIESNLERATYLREISIANVHGHGVAADGRSFIARDHISGVPVDVFNRGEAFGLVAPPSIHDVLQTLIAACRAVHRAHLKGVLHGGIKSSNVLVDDKGKSHVVDFGLNLSPAHAVTDDVVALGRLLFDVLRERPINSDPTLTAIAARATTSDFRQTYTNAGTLADDLTRFVEGKPLSIEVPGLAATLSTWLDRHVGAPSRVMIIGVFAGVMGGLFASAICSGPSIATLATLQSSAVEFSNTFTRLWFWVVAAIWIMMGLFAERLGRPRTATGTWWCGSAAGLIAGCFAWASGAGGAIAAIANRSALSEAGRLSESANIPEHLVQLLAGPATSAAFAAGWLGPLVPILLGTGFGLLGAIASRFVRRQNLTWPEAVQTFGELTLPGQAAMAAAALIAIGDAAGMMTANRVWFLPIAFLGLAALCAVAIQCAVPGLTRAAVYLTAIALIARFAAQPVPLWIECPIYIMALVLVVMYVQSPQQAKQPLFE